MPVMQSRSAFTMLTRMRRGSHSLQAKMHRILGIVLWGTYLSTLFYTAYKEEPKRTHMEPVDRCVYDDRGPAEAPTWAEAFK